MMESWETNVGVYLEAIKDLFSGRNYDRSMIMITLIQNRLWIQVVETMLGLGHSLQVVVETFVLCAMLMIFHVSWN